VFRLVKRDNTNSFENLVIKVKNEIALGYILRYEPLIEIPFLTNQELFRSFEGKIKRFDLKGNLLSEYSTNKDNSRIQSDCIDNVSMYWLEVPTISTATGLPLPGELTKILVIEIGYAECPSGSPSVPSGTYLGDNTNPGSGGPGSSSGEDFGDQFLNGSGGEISPLISPDLAWPGSDSGLPYKWWEDEEWLDANFTIAPTQNYHTLTAEEKRLIKIYPQQAYAISKNVNTAHTVTESLFGISGLNDKSDAFRHAFFNAMNQRDCAKDNQTLESVAKMFADAHESEVPLVLIKEKEMDLWNNNVGLNVGDVMFPVFNSDSELAETIYTKLLSGELRYLNPINRVASPLYDGNRDGAQDCSNCLNGIILTTVLTPTNN
jgi:hypothetical protein